MPFCLGKIFLLRIKSDAQVWCESGSAWRGTGDQAVGGADRQDHPADVEAEKERETGWWWWFADASVNIKK